MNSNELVALGDDWGVIRAAGPDAASFLQGQLTNDVESMATDGAALAGYCSAKGRLQASMIVWRPSPDEFLLACSRDLLAPTLKRLSMFVLRAKCKLGEAGDVAIAGATATNVPGAVRASPPMLIVDGWLRLPDVDGVARAWKLGGDVGAARTTALDRWRWLEVRSGVARIVAATVDAFVPQMINFELVNGVNFGKGCYPGQEVVARSQYRGTLKRRMHLFQSAAAATPGQDVFHDSDTSQPAGTVVNAATHGGGPADGGGAGKGGGVDDHAVLVSLKTALLDVEGQWRLGSAQGPVLTRVANPYLVPQEAQVS